MTNKLTGGQYYFANGLHILCIFSPFVVCHQSMKLEGKCVNSWDFILSQIFNHIVLFLEKIDSPCYSD